MNWDRGSGINWDRGGMDWTRPESTAERAAADELLKINAAIYGATQMGKTTLAVEEEALPLALAGNCYLDYKDPARSGGEKLAKHLIWAGLGDRLHVEDYARLDWFSSPGLLEASRAQNVVEYEEENLEQ